VQARNDIPRPQQFAAPRQQIQTMSAANIASGGRYAAKFGQLLGEKTALDNKRCRATRISHRDGERHGR
jgi:hypothetical protein